MSDYTLTVTVPTDPATTEARVREALASEGFGILSEIDVRAKLVEKVGEDIGTYTILGACNPSLAHRAIGADADIGALLPCNVVLRDSANGGTDVVAVDPRAMLALAGDGMADLADDVRERLQRVLHALA